MNHKRYWLGFAGVIVAASIVTSLVSGTPWLPFFIGVSVGVAYSAGYAVGEKTTLADAGRE